MSPAADPRRIRAEFRHPLSPADTDAIAALRARAVSRGYAVAVIHASWRGTTHFLAVAPCAGETARTPGAPAPAARGVATPQGDGQ